MYKDFANVDWKNDTDQAIDPPFIELSDEDNNNLNDELDNSVATSTDTQIADAELQQEKEVLLLTPEDTNTRDETIKQVINSNLKMVFERRTNNYEFVSPVSHPEYFWAKCFPCLFPYGQGCPNDPKNIDCVNGIGKFTKLVLQRGGGPDARRFQQCPSFYFAVYHYVTRYKIQGLTYLAQNTKYDNDNEELTVSGLTQIMQEMQRNVGIEEGVLASVTDAIDDLNNQNSISEANATPSTTTTPLELKKTLSKQEIKHCLKRLSVYATSLKGTCLYMQNERNKLMAMLASPEIKSEGIWRWFLTITPNDLYDSRLYEILVDDNDLSWKDRAVKSKQLTLQQRKDLLVTHPALAARLFDIKLKCIFDCILKGNVTTKLLSL